MLMRPGAAGPRHVLGLDLATSTGWAYGPVGGTPTAGTLDLNPDLRFEERGARLVRWLNTFCKEHPIDFAGIESPLDVGTLMSKGTNFQTVQTSYGLGSLAKVILHMRGVRSAYFEVQKIRQHFTGRARYSQQYDPVKKRQTTSREEAKQATINACRFRGWIVKNDDEADAMAVWSYTVARIDPRTAAYATPLFARPGR